MSKTSELDINMQNAIDEGMEEMFKITRYSSKKEDEIRETLQHIYSNAMVTTANMIDEPVQQTLTVRRPVKIRPEVIIGIVLCLLAALADFHDLNKVIFGFGIALFYQPLLKWLIVAIIRFVQFIDKITTP